MSSGGLSSPDLFILRGTAIETLPATQRPMMMCSRQCRIVAYLEISAQHCFAYNCIEEGFWSRR